MHYLNKLNIVFGFLLALLATSCDYVDQPIPQDTNTGTVDTTLVYDTTYSQSNVSYRVALLEEFTGQDCANCPLGGKEAHRLDSLYQDSFIVAAVHCTNFAVPTLPDYPDDYRTTAGNTYETTFGVTSIPRGVVSRLNNVTLQSPPSWENDVKSVIAQVPIIKIDLMNAYAESDKKLVTTVNTEWLSKGTASGYKLVCYIIEDSLISPQNVFTVRNPNYLHRHVLRGAINGAWGTVIPSSNVGDKDKQEFTFDFSDKSWKVKDCEVIAYVYDQDTYEIMQATIAHVSKH